MIFNEAARGMEIGRDHLMHELVKGHFAGPTKEALGFCGVSKEKAILAHPSAKPDAARNRFETYSTSAGRKY